jgi:hypothetical protein
MPAELRKGIEEKTFKEHLRPFCSCFGTSEMLTLPGDFCLRIIIAQACDAEIWVRSVLGSEAEVPAILTTTMLIG